MIGGTAGALTPDDASLGEVGCGGQSTAGVIGRGPSREFIARRLPLERRTISTTRSADYSMDVDGSVLPAGLDSRSASGVTGVCVARRDAGEVGARYSGLYAIVHGVLSLAAAIGNRGQHGCVLMADRGQLPRAMGAAS